MKNKKIIGLVPLFMVLLLVLTSCQYSQPKEEKMKIGWMTTWTDGGLVAEVLKNTNVMEINGVNGEMVSFLYGPPMVEAGITGDIDVLFVGWVPAINLISKSDDWFIASRLVYFPMELMAREGSGIKTIKDLKGKKIAVPYATGPYPVVIDRLKKTGLDPKKDLEIVNVKPANLGVALETGEVDAISWAEPTLTLLKQKGLAYPIEEYEDIAFVIVRKSYAEKNPKQVESFLKSLKWAQFHVAKNEDEVMDWFSQDSKFDLELVQSLKIIEPNFKAESFEDIDLTISEKWIEKTQEKIDFEYEEEIISKKINLREEIDLSYLT